MKSGVLTDFHGFNLVVYKDAPIPAAPKTLLQVTYCPWSQIMPCDNFKIIVGDTPDSEGSFYVRGIWEMANKNLREKGYYYDTDPSSWPSLDVISVG
jgi:hypothetical protein